MKLQLLLLACVAIAGAQRRAVPQYRVRDEGAETAPAVNPHAPQPANEESGFVHPIDFSGLLRDSVLGSESSGSPFFGAPLGGSRVQTFSPPQNAAPLFAAAHPAATGATFRPSPQHFGSFGAESQQNPKEEQGFVQPVMHFGSLFDAGAGVFNVKDFLAAHASSQREVEERVNAAAEATGRKDREDEREAAGDDGRRRAAASEHSVYHGAEEEEEAEDEEHPVRTYPSPSRSTPHRSAPADERGPAQFSHRSSSEPNYGPDYSKAIQEAEEGSAAGVAKGKRCRKVAKKVAAEDVGRGRFRRAADKPAMTCYVCEDPENGGSYESCAYASSPKDKSYFESKSFSSKGKGNKYRQRRYLPDVDSIASATNEQEESKDEEKGAGSVEDLRMAYEAVSGDSYDENFKKLFPEFTYKEATSSSASVASASALKPDEEEEESASEEERATDYGYKGPPAAFFLDTAQKKHLEKLVGEFSQKDRTSCKKVMKDKMTCFQCLDEKGMQHEECMFVAKSDPKGRHLAYHELKEYRLVPEDLPSDASAATTSLVNPLRVPAPSAAASENKKKVEERPLSPEEVAEADGVYADETSHAFDPVRKIHLPKYMLKKSEHEAIFEEFVKASHEAEEE